MSRLTTSPFHKPSPFVFPREPISPPETLTDSGYLSTGLPQMVQEPRIEENLTTSIEVPGFHAASRTTSGRPSISYQNSGLRDTQARPVQRSYRFFVVVIPPATVIHDHGQLGRTLASGPPHRLSQGIIMPLFPTMYGQLTAIAKEFNFPSTTGLCLYLHFNENGMIVTPRISDESWNTLWSHLFEPPMTSRGFPIGGRIEFDIDFQQARWYSSWLSTMTRDTIERPIRGAPSTAPSFVHVHGDSRTTIAGDTALGQEDQSVVQSPPRSVHVNRHVPRKLSLVDRIELLTPRPESKASTAFTLDVPERSVSKALSPIAQEEEPRTAREQLDNRVNSWRATAVVKPTPLAGRGQTSLEPINLPNNLSLDGDAVSPDVEFNMEDFTWSISSAGPDDYDSLTVGTLSERLPSPDIARRMLEDCPLTPSTATSWGPPLSWPASPLSDFRAPSLDLGFRSVFSRPVTPSTATSWGPISPTMSAYQPYYDYSPAPSVHLCDRAEFSRPVTPMTTTSWGAPLSYPPSPITPYHAATPDPAQRSFDLAQEKQVIEEQARPWQNVWPYFQTRKAKRQPWRSVWPYFQAPKIEEPKQPWVLVWPYFQASKTVAMEHSKIPSRELGYPQLSIYAPMYPHFDLYPAPAASMSHQDVTKPTVGQVILKPQYPNLCIYAPVYPFNLISLYPVVLSEECLERPVSVFVVASQYPVFDLYPSMGNSKSEKKIMSSQWTDCAYPALNIYPAVYPHFDIYPIIDRSGSINERHSSFDSSYSYPTLIIYRPVYPHFDIYPSINARELKAESATTNPRLGVQVHLPNSYPRITIYPSIYPNLEIYPPVTLQKPKEKIEVPQPNVKVQLPVQYPNFDIYPLVYPSLDIYPSCPETSKVSVAITHSPVVVSASQYPAFDLYPAVYPYFDIYPACTEPKLEKMTLVPASVSSSMYPVFNIYPPVYPHFDLYPFVSKAKSPEITRRTWNSVNISISSYPIICVYPPVYPYFELYPAKIFNIQSTVNKSVALNNSSAYPTFNIYPVVYPNFNLYPPASRALELPREDVALHQSSSYPFLQIYPTVYPHFNIYPAISCSIPRAFTLRAEIPSISRHTTRKQRKSHRDLYVEIFGMRKSKSHRDLHFEVFGLNEVRSHSGTRIPIPAELDILPLNGSLRSTRRIALARSPTGPAMHRPVPPPALPSPSRRLPTPPSSGSVHSPNGLEQMASYRAEANASSSSRRLSAKPSSRVSVAKRASMMQPLRQMPPPKSADMIRRPNDYVPTTQPSGLSRAASLGNAGSRATSVKSSSRSSFMLQRVQGDGLSFKVEPISQTTPRTGQTKVDLSDYPFL